LTKKILKRDIEYLFKKSSTQEDAPMINDVDDFCLWMYFAVGEILFKIVPFFKRPGQKLECSNIELLALELIGECQVPHFDLLNYFVALQGMHSKLLLTCSEIRLLLLPE
jgi:hypothetical protein